MNKEKCLQQITGDCGGCDIYQMAQAKSNTNRNDTSVICKRIEKNYCPEGTTMKSIERPKPRCSW